MRGEERGRERRDARGVRWRGGALQNIRSGDGTRGEATGGRRRGGQSGSGEGQLRRGRLIVGGKRGRASQDGLKLFYHEALREGSRAFAYKEARALAKLAPPQLLQPEVSGAGGGVARTQPPTHGIRSVGCGGALQALPRLVPPHIVKNGHLAQRRHRRAATHL